MNCAVLSESLPQTLRIIFLLQVTHSREKVHALETDLTLKHVSVTSYVELFAISEIMYLGTS